MQSEAQDPRMTTLRHCTTVCSMLFMHVQYTETDTKRQNTLTTGTIGK